MNKRFTITEEEKRRIISMHQTANKNHYIMEKYEGGLIMEGDDLCEIECERKIAAYGSNGDAVKEIQHALSKCGYNTKYEGGGINAGCAKDKNNCDGKFKEHTRDSVKEFQKKNGLTVDGKVGSDTLKKLVSEGCLDDPQCPCDDFKDDFKDIDVFNPIKEIDSIDCEKLKKCVKDHILKPAPDYIGFEKCIGGEQKDNRDLKDNINLDKEGFLEGCTWFIGNPLTNYKRITECPKSLNCMPGINKDMTYCNSKAIKACEAKRCTSITY